MASLLQNFCRLFIVAGFLLCAAAPAAAGPEACAALVNSFNASDVKKAYAFVKDHGECIDRLGEPVFQGLTGALFALKAAGKISQGTCASIMGIGDAVAVKSLTDVAGAGFIAQNISCGCAVIYSGVDTKLKQITEKIAECGKAFDPIDWAGKGLDAATGAVEELGGVFGIGGGGKYAEGPNGGAPTTYYICATVGKWLAPDNRGPDGACGCPQKYKMEWGNGINAPENNMRCVADCPKEQVLKDGTCQTCPSAGQNTETHPDETGLTCETTGWGVGCGDGKKPIGDGKTCVWACPTGEVWDAAKKSCHGCGAGQVPKYVSGLGSTGECKPCPEGTQPISGQCQPCPEGSKWQAPGTCVGAFPSKACTGNEIKDPQHPQDCKPCPRGSVASSLHTACIPATPLRLNGTITPRLPPARVPSGNLKP
jgi:hypothetical protein